MKSLEWDRVKYYAFQSTPCSTPLKNSSSSLSDNLGFVLTGQTFPLVRFIALSFLFWSLRSIDASDQIQIAGVVLWAARAVAVHEVQIPRGQRFEAVRGDTIEVYFTAHPFMACTRLRDRIPLQQKIFENLWSHQEALGLRR